MSAERKIILTRPLPSAERFAAQLRAAIGRDVPVILSPVMGIEALSPPLPPGPFGAVLVTSENGVAALDRLGLPRGLPVLAVGDRTASAAEALGYQARSAGGGADELIELCLALRPDAPLLHLRGRHSRGRVAERLTEAGLPCHEAVTYEQTPRPLTEEALAALNGEEEVILPLFSPRSATLVLGQGPFAAPLRVVAISPAVTAAAAPLRALSLQAARRPDGAAMVEAVRDLFCGAAPLETPRTAG